MSDGDAVQPDAFSISEFSDGDSQRLILAGELDLASVTSFEEHVRRLSRAGVRELIVDLKAVTFIDSSGLRALFGLRDACENRGCDFSVTFLPDSQVAHLIEVAGALESLPLRDVKNR